MDTNDLRMQRAGTGPGNIPPSSQSIVEADVAPPNEARCKRPVVIDGCSVSNSEEGRGIDTGRCISTITYFRNRGHTQIAVVFPRIPDWRANVKASDSKKKQIIQAIFPFVQLSPARLHPRTGVLERSDHKLYLLEMAKNAGGVVVSNNEFLMERDMHPSLAPVIDNRLLHFSITFGRIQVQVVQDPTGMGNENLHNVLHFPPGYKPRNISDDIQELLISNQSDITSDAEVERLSTSPSPACEPPFSMDPDSPFYIRLPILSTAPTLLVRPASTPLSMSPRATSPTSVRFQQSPEISHLRDHSSTKSVFSHRSRYGCGNPPSTSPALIETNRDMPGQRSKLGRRLNREITENEKLTYWNSGLRHHRHGLHVKVDESHPEDPFYPKPTGAPRSAAQLEELVTDPLLYSPKCPLGKNQPEALVMSILTRQPVSTSRDAMAMVLIDEVQKALKHTPPTVDLITFD